MLLGIEGVIDVRSVEKGRFYLRSDYNDEPVLFKCICVGQGDDGSDTLMAIRFAPGSELPMAIESLPHGGPVVALPEVHIRVDAPSLVATNLNSGIRSGMFLIAGEEAFVAVPQNFRSWSLINVTKGEHVDGEWGKNWIAFSRWLFVIKDSGEEITISSFGNLHEPD